MAISKQQQHAKVAAKFEDFRKEMTQYFIGLPMDLRQTLDDIRDYIERNKKDS